MNNFSEAERICELVFSELGKCWHLFTSENNPIIFRNAADFQRGMWAFGIAVLLCPKIRVLTYELMSNHIHVTLAGEEQQIREFFALFKSILSKALRDDGCPVVLDSLECNLRQITTLNDARNVIVYNNRNGFLVLPEYSPFSYPYGANSFYFNTAARELYNFAKKPASNATIEKMVKTHVGRAITAPVYSVQGQISPLCFCDIDCGERLFRNASHYFNCLSKNVESQKLIAKEIGERIFYTDDELYSTVFALSMKQFGLSPAQLSREAKVEIAKTLHYDYNAGNKQINRILKMDINIVNALFPARKPA